MQHRGGAGAVRTGMGNGARMGEAAPDPLPLLCMLCCIAGAGLGCTLAAAAGAFTTAGTDGGARAVPLAGTIGGGLEYGPDGGCGGVCEGGATDGGVLAIPLPSFTFTSWPLARRRQRAVAAS